MAHITSKPDSPQIRPNKQGDTQVNTAPTPPSELEKPDDGASPSKHPCIRCSCKFEITYAENDMDAATEVYWQHTRVCPDRKTEPPGVPQHPVTQAITKVFYYLTIMAVLVFIYVMYHPVDF